jgi:hypothetical protein
VAQVLRSTLLAVLASFVISSGSYFLTDEFVRIWLPRIDAYGSAVVHGFPIPYLAYFPTNESSYLYYPLNFAGDFAVWLVVSFLVISTFTIRRLVLASICGFVVTVSTLLLSPLALATPNDLGSESTGFPMGFPFEYLTRVVGGLPGQNIGVSYLFSLTQALADYLLWLGVVLSAIGLFVLIISRNPKIIRPKAPDFTTTRRTPYHTSQGD